MTPDKKELLGALYDIKPLWLVATSVAAQLLAIVFYLLCLRQQRQEEASPEALPPERSTDV